MVQPVIFADLLSDGLRRAYEQAGEREIVGGQPFRASNLGLCLRMQMLLATGTKPNVPDDRTLRVFQMGYLTQQFVSDMLRKSGVVFEEEVEFHNPEWRMGCHVDFLVTTDLLRGFELKSQNSKKFWKNVKATNGGTVGSEHQFIQAAACWLLAEEGYGRVFNTIDEFYLVTVSKDDLSMQQEPVTQTHREMALHRIGILNRYFEAKELPPCECVGTWQQKYCSLRRGDGTCC